LIHADQQSDVYYKQIQSNNETDSVYTNMPGNETRLSINDDQETDRSLGNEIEADGSVIRQADEQLIYTPNYLQPDPYPNHPITTAISTFKPSMSNSMIIGYCQTEFQSLDPKLLIRSSTTAIEDFQCAQSVHLTTYDSGFIDDTQMKSLNPISLTDNEDTSLTKSETEDDVNAKWKPPVKHVSFQGLILILKKYFEKFVVLNRRTCDSTFLAKS